MRKRSEKKKKKWDTESNPILVTPTSHNANCVYNMSIECAANCAPGIPIEHNPVVHNERTCIVTIDKPVLVSTQNPSVILIETPNTHINMFKGDTSTNPNRTTPAERIAFFCGDQCEGEDPQEFLHAYSISDDQEIANVFIDYLGAGSTADFWYHNLPQAVQNSWDKLKVAFIQQWPEEKNEVVNEVCTTVGTAVPFNWATNVDETVSAVGVTPITLVNHVPAVTFIPMSRAPCDFSTLCSST